MEKLNIKDTSVNMDSMARTQSLITGAGLLYSGLSQIKKPSTISIVKTLFGGYLVYRGLTGHCHMNQILERNSAGE
ncbi:MAG: YgaP-like transmembrane domain [Bacteroidota bacterium]